MSQEYTDSDPLSIAQQAERDLNSEWAKGERRKGASDSTRESGVDENVETKFPGAQVKTGPESSGREISIDEGGDINPDTGKLYKADDFEGTGGPEDKARIAAEVNPGSNDVRENIRQGGETIRPPGSAPNEAADGLGKSQV